MKKFMRSVAVTTAGAFLFTSLGAAPAEASFWKERAAAARVRVARSTSNHPLLLAQAPMGQVLSFSGISSGTQKISHALNPMVASAPAWVRPAISPFADVRSVHGGTAKGPNVFIVMDAHDVFSAQKNVARLLDQLGGSGTLLVGVEGTTGAFDLERHRGLLPKPQQAVLTEHLLKKGFINGPEAFGITADRTPALWGVETPALYEANVKAYRDALPLMDETRTALAILTAQSREQARKLFSPALWTLDNEVQAMHEDRGDLGRYVQTVATEQINASAVGPQARKFLEAKKLEDQLDFSDVEQARAAFIERVSPRLSPYELETLIQNTASYRAGSTPAGLYYKNLEAVALSKGVPVSAYPPFKDYIRYVKAADGINASALMEELEQLEDHAYAQLAKGDALLLVEWIKDLRLAQRATQHALTPREWNQFSVRRSALDRLVQRAGPLGFSVDSARTLQQNLPTFAAFFEAANARNGALLENLLAQSQRRNASTAVLVTGGFHAPALEKSLTQRGLSFAVLSPRISETPDAPAGYLQAFAPTRTPLERLLLGDRLFMNPPSATAVSLQNSASPFHAASVALDRAAATYGVAVAENVSEFVDKWNGQIGRNSPASVDVKETNGAKMLSVTFDGAEQEVLMATAGEGRAQSDLESEVKKAGARVVESDRLGNVPYVLGGKNLSRFVPETLAGAAYLVWLGGSALSPPLLLTGLAAWVMVGGIIMRGMFLLSVYWHGLGHAVVSKAFGGNSVMANLRAYADRLSAQQLIPFADIFIPALGAPEKAPRFEEPSLMGGQRRMAALAGPAANLLVVGLAAPFLYFAGPFTITDLALAALAGANLWAAVTSVSDFRTALSGVGRVFACGVIGVVYGGPNAKAEMMPTGVQHLMDESVLRTLHRGGQSGGIAVVGVKENGHAEFTFFVEKRAKEGNRRARLGELMRDATSQLARRAGKAGFGGLRRLLVVGHTRYGTNLAQPVALNAHPHLGTNDTDTLIYIGEKNRVDNYERPWEKPRGVSAVKSIPMTRGVAIAHNGDDNATVLYRYGEKDVVLTNDEDALLNERMTGFKNPAKGDSPQIATRMERWITQGSVAASLRLTLLMVAMESLRGQPAPFETILERAPTPALMETLLQSQALQTFPSVVQALHRDHPTAGLEELFQSAGARVGAPEDVWNLEAAIPFAEGSDIDKHRKALASQARAILQSSPWFMELSENDQERLAARFSELFLKFFFTGDFRRAGVHLLRRADSTSTFGVMAGTLMESEGALWLRQNQPFYLWVSADGKSVAGSSEAKAFLGAKSGESPFRYRLTLRNGEVATLRGSRLVIDHVDDGRVTEFDLSEMDKVIAQPRWLDLETSPYVSPSSSLKVAPEHRVREDLEMVPWVNQKIKEDFANPQSNNSLSGRAFVDLLVQRLMKRRASQKGGELDLVIVGTEKSYDAAVLHSKALAKIASMAGKPLNIQVVYGAEFTAEDLEDLRNKGFGPDTVVMGLASSGQTANTLYALESLNMAWRGLRESLPGQKGDGTPPHFLVSADMDNPYTEEVLGQGLADGDPFKARNFVTFPTLDSFHPAEAATVTHKATERLLKEVSVLFAETLVQKSRRWKNGGLGQTVPAATRHMVDNGDELDRRITGLDADGNPHRVLRQTGERNDIPDQIDAVAGRMSQAFLESLWATASTALFISLTLLFHATPATFLLGWFPNQVFLFSAGLPVLAAIVGLSVLGATAWKTRLWRWNPILAVLGGVVFVSVGLFLGESLVLGLDSLGSLLGKGALGSRWGFLPVPLDVSPVNLMNAVTYVFFFFGVTLGLRTFQRRPLWDRLGGRILVLSDYQHSVARLSAARWRRILSHRFGWMGLNSINESSLGRLTHEEALNSNVRGNLFLLGEARHAEGPTLMNYKQLGGSPNGPGRIWRMGIGHKSKDAASAAYSEGYISLTMKGDNPAGEDPALGTLQELLQDAPARDTAGMVLSLVVAEKMSSIKPLGFVPGMTSSEAKTSTTQQPFPPLSEDAVRGIFGLDSKSTEAAVKSPRQEVDEVTTQREEPFANQPTIGLEDNVVPNGATAETEGPSIDKGGEFIRSESLSDSRQGKVAALAKFLGLSTNPGETTEQLERNIRGRLISRKQIDVPSEHEVALVFALLHTEAYVKLIFDDEKIQFLSLEDFRDRRVHGRIPPWDSFRVVYNDHFLLSETPIDTGAETVAVESSDHRASLRALAGFLNLSVAEADGDGPLAEIIEKALKSNPGKALQIPGQYEDGLIAVFAHAKQRNLPPIHAFFNDGRMTSFPESLDGYLYKRHGMSAPWENYYVTYNDVGLGMPFFSVMPNTHSSEIVPTVEGVRDVRADEESRSLEKSEAAPDVAAELEAVSVQEGERGADTSLEPASNGGGSVNSDPTLASDALAQHEVVSSEDRAYRHFILKTVGKLVRATMVFITAILLTSWGGAFVSSIEGTFSKIIGNPQAHEITPGPQSAVSQPGLILSENGPHAFVNTKNSPLISYDRSPAEKPRVVGRVSVHSSVKIIERKGSWVLVSPVSGAKGWVNSRSLEKGRGGRVTIARSTSLLETRPAVRMKNLSKGAELVVLRETQGKWVRVVPVNGPKIPVWVSREYVSPLPGTPDRGLMKTSMAFNDAPNPPSFPQEPIRPDVQEVLGLLGRPLPVLGKMARRRMEGRAAQTRPGEVLRQRLMSGARQEFEAGPTRDAAMALAAFIHQTSSLDLDPVEKQLSLAVGYGVVAGEKWAQKGPPKDRALYDDYRHAREFMNGASISLGAGRALTGLARFAARSGVHKSALFAEGSLPVIDLTFAESQPHVLKIWAAALERTSRGGLAPLVLARDFAQQERLQVLLNQFALQHPELNLEKNLLSSSHWIHSNTLTPDVALRDEEGTLLSVRLGALLTSVGINVAGLTGVDIVTGGHSKIEWNRSDLPKNIAVRLIVSILDGIAFAAALDEAQAEIRSVRRALTAA